jgi:hypothetical protein
MILLFSRISNRHGCLSNQDRYANPLLCPDWGADEEWLLMEAIELFGLGNWADIADHVGACCHLFVIIRHARLAVKRWKSVGTITSNTTLNRQSIRYL